MLFTTGINREKFFERQTELHGLSLLEAELKIVSYGKTIGCHASTLFCLSDFVKKRLEKHHEFEPYFTIFEFDSFHRPMVNEALSICYKGYGKCVKASDAGEV